MTVGRYVTRLVAGRVLAILLGFVVLGLSFDLAENGPELIEAYGLGALGPYALMRAPAVLVTVFPLGVLVGATLAFLALAARSEMVVLRASGLNTLRVLGLLLPLALGLGLAQNQLAGWLGPAAEAALVERYPELYETAEIEDEVWLREWQGIIRIGAARDEARELVDISIFETGPEGALLRRIDAERARYAGDRWRLFGVTLRRFDQAPERLGEMAWQTRLTPAGVLGAARRPELVAAEDVRKILAGERPGARGTPYYLVQLWRGYAALVVPAVMLVFAAMASFGLLRSGGGAGHVALGLGLGALFVLVDGVFASLGQVGAMRATLAAFMAPAIFFVVGLWSIVLVEE